MSFHVSLNPDSTTVGVVGLGYVGLPLAVAFGRALETIGYDVSTKKIEAYRNSKDPSGEVSLEDFKSASKIRYTNDSSDLKKADFLIVAVPTPIDSARRPDLTIIKGASEQVGKALKKGAIVIYESTVYPGLTEKVCVPILEKTSGMACGKDFFVGYSPERINPGDPEHSLEKVVKVVAGQDQQTLEAVAWLYGLVVKAGVYQAKSIMVAEAAKVIENTQRDLNIALMNELSMIFEKMGIDTLEVLEAAETKWNFLPFRPGLVGGHCIGVDPYYLTYRAEELGYHPEVVLAGRRINDGMGKYVAEQMVKQMIQAGKPIKGSNVLVLGLTFKENCPDIRNSRVIDVVNELKSYGASPVVWDPVVDPLEAKEVYGLNLLKDLKDLKFCHGVIAAVPHKEILNLDFEAYAECFNQPIPFIDVKSKFDRETIKNAGFRLWRL